MHAATAGWYKIVVVREYIANNNVLKARLTLS
jgi:hypothetical protein